MAVKLTSYLRLETDDEFVRRVFGIRLDFKESGPDLDDMLWSKYQRQRKIVEVTT